MLRTWRTGGPNREPVFGLAVQEELEGRTWGREYVRQMQQVRLVSLDFPWLDHEARRMYASRMAGPDRRSFASPTLSHSVRPRRDRQQAIFARAAAPATVPEPPKAPRALLAQQAQQQAHPYGHSSSPFPTAYPPPAAPVAYYQQQYQQPGRSPLPQQYATPPTVSTTPLPPPPAATGGLDTNLLSFLSGLLNKAGSTGGASPAPSIPTDGVATPEQQEMPEPEIDEYDEEPDAFERLVLELNVRLENLDLKACVVHHADVSAAPLMLINNVNLQ